MTERDSGNQDENAGKISNAYDLMVENMRRKLPIFADQLPVSSRFRQPASGFGQDSVYVEKSGSLVEISREWQGGGVYTQASLIYPATADERVVVPSVVWQQVGRGVQSGRSFQVIHDVTFQFRGGSDGRAAFLEQRDQVCQIIGLGMSGVQEFSLHRKVTRENGQEVYGKVVVQSAVLAEMARTKIGGGRTTLIIAYDKSAPRENLLRFQNADGTLSDNLNSGILRGLGISVKFSEDEEDACLDVAVDQWSFKLEMGKQLAPNYHELMFADDPQIITESSDLKIYMVDGSRKN